MFGEKGGFLELGFECGVLWILGYGLVRLVERCGWVVEVVSRTWILGFLKIRVFDGFG